MKGVLLAIDVGNTNVVFGAYRGADLIGTWRTATVHDRTYRLCPSSTAAQ